MDWDRKASDKLESRSSRKEVPSVWLVQRPGGNYDTEDSFLKIFCWHGENSSEVFIPGVWYGKSVGCGYDRMTAAMDGCVIFGVEIKDNGDSFRDQLNSRFLRVISVL